MTKEEIVNDNKVTLEYLLQENEFICEDIVKSFWLYVQIADDYLYRIYNILSEKEFMMDYDKMEISDTISLVREFLLDLSPKYLQIFDKLLVDGTFELFLSEDNLIERPSEPVAMGKPNAIIYIPINYNLSDGAIIIHEFFHYLNNLEKYRSIRDIFTEMISIYFELRFLQFLDNNGISDNSFSKGICKRAYYTISSAENLFYTSSIFDIYYNTGEISKKSIKFIDKYRHLYSENMKNVFKFYISEDFSKNMNNFRDDMSYLIGTLLSFNALKEPKVSDIKMCYINDNMSDMNMGQVLDVLEISFDRYLDLIRDCQNILKKAKGELDEKGYSYSRTNSRR